MTRKDYCLIAAAFAETRQSVSPMQWIAIVRAICDKLEGDNERFDRAKFKRACYGEK